MRAPFRGGARKYFAKFAAFPQDALTRAAIRYAKAIIWPRLA